MIGDPTRLRQALMNLTGNAIKFTESGGVSIEVAAAGDQSGRFLFQVRDTGIGIPLEKQPHIFDSFTQADGETTRRYGGTGLGLAISHRLIALMGGDLGVDSEPGRGSVFSFSLHLPAAPNVAAPPEHTPPPPQLPRLRVLVVEDNPVNQRVAAGLLTRHGHHVEVVSNGLLALEACQARQFDAVLMDVHMPEMGGLEATRAIRSIESIRHLPIIGLTANAWGPAWMTTCRNRSASTTYPGHFGGWCPGYLTGNNRWWKRKVLKLHDLRTGVSPV